MKNLSFILLLLVVFSLLYSAPLRNLATQITQPDNSVYDCFATGDEYYHRMHDAKGYTIVQNPQTGWFVYAEKRGLELVPGIHVPGIANPEALGLAPNLMISEDKIRERVERFRGSSRDQYGRTSTTGTVNNISIFVRFSDQTEYTDAVSTYDSMFNSTTSASLKGYFQEESSNQLTVETTFYPPAVGGIVRSYQDPNPRAYYSPYNAATNPTGYTTVDQGFCRLHVMLANAVMAVAGTIPPGLNIDHDSDGIVDNISFICQGPTDAWADVLWPHYWNLDYYNVNPIPIPPYTVPLVYINGSMVDDYNFELSGAPIDVAVVCHEFSHTLGFPDLYHYTWDGIDPCGWWDLMDYCQGTPQHHLAYMKWRYGGWFATMPTITGPGDYTVTAIATSPYSCYWMPAGASEWYVFEYRKQVGTYETTVPGNGLIVYRVRPDITPYGNAGGPPDEVYVYRPGGTPTTNGNINSAFYAMNQGRSAMNIYTNPAPYLSTGAMGSIIMHHVMNDNSGTITFTIGSAIPNIWTGLTSTAWNNAGNWSKGTVPTITDNVIISGLNPPNWPVLSTTQLCADLRIEQNYNVTTQLLINPGSSLQVTGKLECWGNITLLSSLAVDSDFLMRFGGQLHAFPGGTPQINVRGDCIFDNGSILNMNAGTFVIDSLIPGLTTYVHCYANQIYFFDLTINKTPGTVHFSNISTTPLTVNGNMLVGGASTCYIDTGWDFNLAGNLTVNPGGHLYATNGMFLFMGLGTPQTLDFTTTDSYFNHLKILNVVNQNSNIRIKADILFDLSAMLVPGFNSVYLGGDWINNSGPPAFVDAGSRVIFEGTADQHIITPLPSPPQALFDTLELDKPTGMLLINTPGQMIQCNNYDYTQGTLKVSDGLFVALDLWDGSITGNFTCSNTGQIDLNTVTGTVDLNGNLDITGGVVNVYGGVTDSQWPGSIPGSITMGNGVLQFHNVGIIVNNIAIGFAENITGGTIKVAGGFDIQRSDFNPIGGTIEFTGTADVQIGMPGGGAGAGPCFHNIVINKSSRTADNFEADYTRPPDNRTHSLNTLTALQINGDLIITAGSIFDLYNDIAVNGLFTLDGTMQFSLPSTATINGTPSFSATGALLLLDGTFIVSNSLSPTTVNLDGNIAIDMGTFELQDHGLNINPTGSIAFGAGGGGSGGSIICAAFSATTAGTFTCGTSTLEMANSSSSAVGLLDVAAGNNIYKLKINTAGTITYNNDVYMCDCEIVSGVLSCTNDYAIVRIERNWTGHVAHGFLPANGTVKFIGSYDTFITSHTAVGEEFHDLVIDKDVDTLYVYLNGKVTLLGSGQCGIDTGRLHLNGNLFGVPGDINVNSGGYMYLDDDSILEKGNGSVLHVNSGGYLYSEGHTGHEVLMKNLSSGYWNLHVYNGGYISAKYTEFNDLNNQGVCADSSAIIDNSAPFDYCTFQYGQSGCTLLTINNTQTLTITGLNFPLDSGETYNVAKQADYGNLTLNSAVGSFAGPINEDDVYNRIYWSGYNPNLTITGFGVSDTSPYVGDSITYSVTIYNNSADSVRIPFKVHFFKNRSSAPGWTETGDFDVTGSPMAGYASQNLAVPDICHMIAESWTSWTLVDPEEDVYETNETDNRQSTPVNWIALPAVSITLATTSTTTGRISWTYPIWVDRFKVYYDSDPYGSFSSLLGTTTNLYYDVSLSASSRFYMVIAERDAP